MSKTPVLLRYSCIEETSISVRPILGYSQSSHTAVLLHMFQEIENDS